MKRILKWGLILLAVSFASACTPDPSVYDVKSPCVSNPSLIYSDQPCERRLPLENSIYSGMIAAS